MPQNVVTQKVWMYLETDGDSGYYAVRLFTTKAKAEAYKASRTDSERAYAQIKEVTLY